MRAMADTPRVVWSPSRFVLLPENRSAVLAVRRLARALERPRSAGPFLLLLHGPPGCGKTHLADALLDHVSPWCDAVRRDAADWATPDDLVPDELRHCDLLVVEDLQHLPQRAAHSLASLLDERMAHRRQTLLTAAKGPADLDLPARLASRLCAGLVVGIDGLSLEGRRALLEHLASPLNLTVRVDVLDWLAQHLPGSGRQLLAALRQLQALTVTLSQLPDVAAVSALFSTGEALPPLSLERITQQVGKMYEVAPAAIRGPGRQPSVLWPRQLSIYLARELMGLSLSQIGHYFDRDHTTVRHAWQKVSDLVQADAEVAARVRQLKSELVG